MDILRGAIRLTADKLVWIIKCRLDYRLNFA
jgi:hypothetical protein